ncbi:nitrogenase iron-molybdenum cofactor biosynthesis protein NifN [Rhizobium leguminosarum]|uniref:nitrogenase iron-molybdenum cofactor biosynthesis protein NifN n=2 Tax=Rhizobium leguminosarum TaxID=384 RepID=UPI001C92A69B|nr:nitrogenase iron-molybdenum cofactor biosynthesis protein NifN [Rhizobium leguminosarum]MBY2918669.1 nitrogenase iron-molybdenum cofactor biosynthesis protein NifN [Rhizobium leguminosarum]MBY2973919.1 nitrogenase iron-molybdenum cofactor biosynthesis protein NifN [Rhizobium leguminosarum]MBY2981319.1 nitrogenase iron-molybdenum cofactor biosynthesis protein NifN [Rhizobium leguminosarum]MBY3009869.1 nitrogenase iron-molybdenum cofactor biosynthesis protein NifN [Rhizobium leguminosarum]
MARVVSQTKSAAVNPLKSSQPLGAAFAFLGIDGAIPLLHGSQGCTSFALALLVRNFNEAIPLQTTAMNEAAIIVGGADRLEEAILSLKARIRPRLIGICTTASVEARDEDVVGDVENIKRRRAIELIGTEVVVANTPDFEGAIEEGWSKAVTAMIETITRADKQYRDAGKIAILAGCNLTVADIEHLRETAVSFGLDPVILPDVSGALDGSIPEEWMPTTYGGTKVQEIRDLGTAMQCIAIGEHMRRSAEALQRLTGVPYVLFRSLTGLKNVDRFIRVLAALSRKQTPLNVRRNRMQLQDAMLDGHSHMAGKKIAIASEPDQLFQFSDLFTAMGAKIAVAVTTTGTSKVLEMIPANTVKVGDLSDLESLAATADLIATHSHGREAAKRLGVPLMRLGLPIFDRVGSQQKLTILYRGTRDVIFDLANIIQANHPANPRSG